MNKPLAENTFGHGGKRSLLRTKIRRFIRPAVGKAEIPFDWSSGFDIESKIGVIPTKNQFQSDSCGGQAASYFVAAVTALLTGQPYNEISAKSIYAPIAYPGGGTTVGSVENQVTGKGYNTEIEVPSTVNGTETEPEMTDKTWMNAANLKLAMARAGWTCITVNIDIDSIAEAIRDYGAVCWEIGGQNGLIPSWLSDNPQPPISHDGIWGHFMFLGGAVMRNAIKAIKSCQSWGLGVGDSGRQYFNQNYIDSGYIYDVFTFTKNFSTPTLPTDPFKFSTPMSYGQTSNDVKQLQIKLGVSATGYFGMITLTAVFIFQIKNNIRPFNGTVGPTMINLLNAE